MVRKTAILPNVPKEETDILGSLGSPQPQPVETKKGRKKVIYYESESDDEEEEEQPQIQRKKVVKQPIAPAPIIEPPQPTPKPKKVMTEKQLEALRRGQETRLLKAQEKRELQRQQDEEIRKRREDLIVKKALSIKKKQLKQQQILDEISDDDTPIEELPKRKPPVPKPKPQPQLQQQKPKFYFV